jgi:hypothetical protein
MDGHFHRHLENCYKRYGEFVLMKLKPTNLKTLTAFQVTSSA